MKVILALLLAITLHTQAKAETSSSVEMQGMQAALDARDGFVKNLINKNFTKITHDAMDHAIQEMVIELRSRNDEAMAQDLLAQWNGSEGIFFSDALTLGLLELGDHDPLFKWLEDFFGQMSQKYGDIIFTLPIVKDIRMMNFAIPVVFTPKGKWQSADLDNRIEYRKHFIPFANLVTYYAALYGCNFVVQKNGMGQLKKMCKKAAEKLEFAMGRYVAPVISDWIFKQTNRKVSISPRSLQYTTAEELRQAIQAQY